MSVFHFNFDFIDSVRNIDGTEKRANTPFTVPFLNIHVYIQSLKILGVFGYRRFIFFTLHSVFYTFDKLYRLN